MVRDTIADWASDRGEKWRRQIAGLEATIAPIDAPLIAALRLDAPLRIADVGCGGGATTREVLRRAPVGSVVHGFDLSPALIDAARARQHGGSDAIAFHVADMAQAPPPGGRYDRLISRFGIMFFADAPAAFANLRRWLGPGGRFAFAAWGPVHDNVWMTATRAALDDLITLPAIDPATPGPFRYGDAADLLSLLAGAGFSDLDVHDWRGLLPIGGGLPAADAARFALASYSTFAEQLAEAGGDAADRAARALESGFAPFEHDGAVRMPARVHLVTGGA